MARRSTAMPEGDKEAQVPGHGVDMAAKVGLQAAQGGHHVGPAVCASHIGVERTEITTNTGNACKINLIHDF
jgi:hypothetical protein